MFPKLGMGELVIILLIVVILFGANKLPQLGEGLGKGIRSFKKAFGGDAEEPPEKPAQTSSTSASDPGQGRKQA
jgi:sec-independent protein translocase protein TatA